jgi:hypothetical protein
VLAPAGALAREEGEHDAQRPVHARPRIVGHDIEGDSRLAVGLSDEGEDARQGEVVHVVRGIVSVGAVLPEARERAVDDPGIQGANGLVVGAEPLHHARPEALHEHVGLSGEPLEDGLALGGLEVEGERALVPVDVGEGGTAPAVGGFRRLGGRLDLEDLRAHVREHHAGQLRGRHTRELEHLDAVENTHSVS